MLLEKKKYYSIEHPNKSVFTALVGSTPYGNFYREYSGYRKPQRDMYRFSNKIKTKSRDFATLDEAIIWLNQQSDYFILKQDFMD